MKPRLPRQASEILLVLHVGRACLVVGFVAAQRRIGDQILRAEAAVPGANDAADADWLEYGAEEERVVFEIADSILYTLLDGLIADLNAIELHRNERAGISPAAAAAADADIAAAAAVPGGPSLSSPKRQPAVAGRKRA